MFEIIIGTCGYELYSIPVLVPLYILSTLTFDITYFQRYKEYVSQVTTTIFIQNTCVILKVQKNFFKEI